MKFMEVWIGYTIFGVSAFSAMFFWAVRTHQFTDFDRARHIALRTTAPDEETETHRPGRVDRYAWAVVVSIALGIIVSVLWVGFKLNNQSMYHCGM